jgi:thioredoxin reductase
MKSNYQHIFTPLTVKNMTIKNRIVMMPMGTNYGEQNGEMSFLHINYYKERAKGGTGLIIVENASVDSPQGSNGTTQLRIDHDNYLPRLYKFCEEIHKFGGGTAGLEAACTAAEVGCNTFLLEKGNELGGLASLISKIPAKNRLADFPHYLMHRAEQLDNLYIFKNTEGTPENIRKFHPNIIVSSTGSAPLLPPIAGLKDRIDNENHNIYSILGMISHINDFPKDLEGKKVVVVGGGAVGLDVVEFFADRNADISIVEMMDQIGRDLDPVSKNDTKTMMKKHNVHQLTKTALLEVKDSSFLVRGDGEPYELPFEYGFVCLGMRAQGQLYQNLTEEFSSEDVEIMNIGDSQRARRIIDGTQEGRNILTILEQKGYL